MVDIARTLVRDRLREHDELDGLTDDDHSQYIKDSEYTAKGDILAGTAAGTFLALGVGSDDQILTAASAESSGIKWAAAAAGYTDAEAIAAVEGEATLDLNGNVYLSGGDLKTDRWLESDTNVFIGVGVAGEGSLTHGSGNEGWNNIFIGNDAGYSATTATRNVFIGDRAGYANTTGEANFFIGQKAGEANTTAIGNFFLGPSVGYKTTTGGDNVFIGSVVGVANTTGANNVFLGKAAGYANTTGGDNAFIGAGAGYSNTTSSSSVYIGIYTGYNATGARNIAVGYMAGRYVTGADNVMLGYQAGLLTSSGANNILIGCKAADNLTTGGTNIIIGYDINASAVDVSNELNIGGVLYGTLTANQNITINATTVSANYDLMLAGDGVLGLKETTTPTADADYGKIYTKNDNKLYCQTGDGVEHEVAFV